jgi:hypothetical protein
MPTRTKNGVPVLLVKKGASRRAIMAQFKKEFSAADLQKYTTIEDTIPFRQIVAEVEKIQRQNSSKKKSKR